MGTAGLKFSLTGSTLGGTYSLVAVPQQQHELYHCLIAPAWRRVRIRHFTQPVFAIEPTMGLAGGYRLGDHCSGTVRVRRFDEGALGGSCTLSVVGTVGGQLMKDVKCNFDPATGDGHFSGTIHDPTEDNAATPVPITAFFAFTVRDGGETQTRRMEVPLLVASVDQRGTPMGCGWPNEPLAVVNRPEQGCGISGPGVLMSDFVTLVRTFSGVDHSV